MTTTTTEQALEHLTKAHRNRELIAAIASHPGQVSAAYATSSNRHGSSTASQKIDAHKRCEDLERRGLVERRPVSEGRGLRIYLSDFGKTIHAFMRSIEKNCR